MPSRANPYRGHHTGEKNLESHGRSVADQNRRLAGFCFCTLHLLPSTPFGCLLTSWRQGQRQAPSQGCPMPLQPPCSLLAPSRDTLASLKAPAWNRWAQLPGQRVLWGDSHQSAHGCTMQGRRPGCLLKAFCQHNYVA